MNKAQVLTFIEDNNPFAELINSIEDYSNNSFQAIYKVYIENQKVLFQVPWTSIQGLKRFECSLTLIDYIICPKS